MQVWQPSVSKRTPCAARSHAPAPPSAFWEPAAPPGCSADLDEHAAASRIDSKAIHTRDGRLAMDPSKHELTKAATRLCHTPVNSYGGTKGEKVGGRPPSCCAKPSP